MKVNFFFFSSLQQMILILFKLNIAMSVLLKGKLLKKDMLLKDTSLFNIDGVFSWINLLFKVKKDILIAFIK